MSPPQINPIDGLRNDLDAIAQRLDVMQGALDRLADQIPSRIAAAASSLEAIQTRMESPKRWRGLVGQITWGVLLGTLATATIASLIGWTLVLRFSVSP